ncbi:hypothetical protein EI94DRAFT_1705456 [Lactarius quietus]|nr:hypothetical protein EI94DRAFT_1705456 [Lactarius quietus]
MTVSRDPQPSCNNLPASIWVTHELANSACLVICEVAVVFCRYECPYGLLFFYVFLITCLPGTCVVSVPWQLEQGLSVTRASSESYLYSYCRPLGVMVHFANDNDYLSPVTT